VVIVDDKKITSSGWKKKEKIVKFIKKEIEKKIE
jgi:phosphopantothenoylcysteine decarboxylase/phosphopantothenate--cysteine ligase